MNSNTRLIQKTLRNKENKILDKIDENSIKNEDGNNSELSRDVTNHNNNELTRNNSNKILKFNLQEDSVKSIGSTNIRQTKTTILFKRRSTAENIQNHNDHIKEKIYELNNYPLGALIIDDN